MPEVVGVVVEEAGVGEADVEVLTVVAGVVADGMDDVPDATLR